MSDQKPPGIKAATELLKELDARAERLKTEFIAAAKAADDQRLFIDKLWSQYWIKRGWRSEPPMPKKLRKSTGSA